MPMSSRVGPSITSHVNLGPCVEQGALMSSNPSRLLEDPIAGLVCVLCSLNLIMNSK